jgi:hypothetical protein
VFAICPKGLWLRLLILDDGFSFENLLTSAAYKTSAQRAPLPNRHGGSGNGGQRHEGLSERCRFGYRLGRWRRQVGKPREKFKSRSQQIGYSPWVSDRDSSSPQLEKEGPVGREDEVSVEQFRRRADECRRLAAAARNASDRAFWLGLVERWQTLESQKAQQAVRGKSRSPLRRQSELPADG